MFHIALQDLHVWIDSWQCCTSTWDGRSSGEGKPSSPRSSRVICHKCNKPGHVVRDCQSTAKWEESMSPPASAAQRPKRDLKLPHAGEEGPSARTIRGEGRLSYVLWRSSTVPWADVPKHAHCRGAGGPVFTCWSVEGDPHQPGTYIPAPVRGVQDASCIYLLRKTPHHPRPISIERFN